MVYVARDLKTSYSQTVRFPSYTGPLIDIGNIIYSGLVELSVLSALMVPVTSVIMGVVTVFLYFKVLKY
jgi:hypothetical protein